MTKKKVIGLPTGYRSLSNVGNQWYWNTKIPLSGWNSEQQRNGGLYVTYSGTGDDDHNYGGDFWYHTCYQYYNGIPNGDVYWPFKHPKMTEPKHPYYYENGSNKFFVIGGDRSGWQYQTKSISTWQEVYANKDKVFFMSIKGHRSDPYSVCYSLWHDPYANLNNLKYEAAINDNPQKNVWFSHLAYKSTTQSMAVDGNFSTPKQVRSSRLRNVVGFRMDCMFWGYSGPSNTTNNITGLYPVTVACVMHRPWSSQYYLTIFRERTSGGLKMPQRIDEAKYWGDGDGDADFTNKMEDMKGQRHTISFYANKKQAEAIVRDKLEFCGIWLKLSAIGHGGPSVYGTKEFACWNFRPFVCGQDATLSDTFNSKCYNILPKSRNFFTKKDGIYLI